jgi:hypothetical protein
MGYGTAGGETGDRKCFVATACYGEHDNVTNSLRKWRDEALLGNDKAKKLFIKAYYKFLGQPGAKLLRALPWLKPLARKMITLFVRANKIKTD